MSVVSSQQFSYRKKFPTVWIISFLVSFIFSLVIYFFEWSITYKNHVILAFPTSFYVVGTIAFLGLLLTAHMLLVYLVINKSGLDLVVMSDQLLLPWVSKYKAKHQSIVFKEIKTISIKEDEDDGESVIIETSPNQDTYELYAVDFVREPDYVSFKKLLKDNCPHLFNAI